MPSAQFHLPGLFEFYDFYCEFLPLTREHREWFYENCAIASIYGAPADCLWNGGRAGFGDAEAEEVFSLLREYRISPRLTFSNSLLREAHLGDRRCHRLCRLAEENSSAPVGIIVHSELLTEYLHSRYPTFYFVSSTTKVLTKTEELREELAREEFCYVVPDFRWNMAFEKLSALPTEQKGKIELLVNECCSVGCAERKRCYETVSRKNLGEDVPDHCCSSPHAAEGYRFSRAMESPAFVSREDIFERWLPAGISQFKIEGRGLGSAVLLEFLLYYMVKPEYQLRVREEIYLDSMLDLF